ncbi:MAG: hypothetical protein BGO77_03675 [Caedibacter sp. 37-49]|nr:MAG: hypothetical protein BGO77_03675 [Caedibacter sp. 37-49]
MVKVTHNTVLQLAENDAAIVLREDGTLEASMPEIHSENVPENVLTGAAILYALNNSDICQLIFKNFAEQCKNKS